MFVRIRENYIIQRGDLHVSGKAFFHSCTENVTWAVTDRSRRRTCGRYDETIDWLGEAQQWEKAAQWFNEHAGTNSNLGL